MTVDNDMAGDVRKLAQLKELEDPRTIDEMVADDDYAVVTVEKVGERRAEGWTTISWDHGTTTGFQIPDGVEVKVGDTLWLYGGSGLGQSCHGWALNGKLIKWETPWERFSKRIKWLAQYDRDKRERFAEERAELDRKYEVLPDPLKARIDRFRAESESFRVDSEGYEMMAVWDAPKIQKALQPEVDAGGKPEDVVEAFRALSYEEQKAKVPDLDEGHSGNTFGGAVMLAYRLLSGQEC